MHLRGAAPRPRSRELTARDAVPLCPRAGLRRRRPRGARGSARMATAGGVLPASFPPGPFALGPDGATWRWSISGASECPRFAFFCYAASASSNILKRQGGQMVLLRNSRTRGYRLVEGRAVDPRHHKIVADNAWVHVCPLFSRGGGAATSARCRAGAPGTSSRRTAPGSSAR